MTTEMGGASRNQGPDGKTKRWLVPDWMKPYEHLITGHGGNGVEDIMNRNEPNLAFTNIIVYAMKCEVYGQVGMLTRLYEAGLLNPVPRD